MILLIASTSSGGHFYPALHLGQALRYRGEEVLLAVFGDNTMFETNEHWILQFNKIKHFKKFLLSRKVAIDVAISFGSRKIIIPSLVAKKYVKSLWIHEQNVIPGKANKFLFNFADRILLSFSGSESFVPAKFLKKIVVIGYPVNEYYKKRCENIEKIYKDWGIPKEAKIVVFSGGSKGSVEINVIASSFITRLIDRKIDNVYVVWQRGQEDILMYAYNGLVFKFSTDLMCLYDIADLVVSRSGAGSIAELVFLYKKAIMVPLRGVAGDHQYFNAIYSGYPVYNVDQLIFDTIYSALLDEDSALPNSTKLRLMDYQKLLNLVYGRG